MSPLKALLFIRYYFVLASAIVLVQKSAGQTMENSPVSTDNQLELRYQVGDDLHAFITDAPAFAHIQFDPSEEIEISEPVIISQPVTISGLHARLPDSLEVPAMIIVDSEHVTIRNFSLSGNAETISQDKRAPLIWITRGAFMITDGAFFSSSKDGVMISPKPDAGNLAGGVIRNISGDGNVRDLISISGTAGSIHSCVTNILVENVRAYNSVLRGPVEVSDGARNITVRKVYAENCRYALDVQDHNRNTEVNQNILIEDVYALNCEWAVRTMNHSFGHSNLSLKNITAEHCEKPIQLSNTDGVVLENLRVVDQTGSGHGIDISACNQVMIRDVAIMKGASIEAGIRLKNCSDVLIDGVFMLEGTDQMTSGVTFSLTKDTIFSNLQIHNVSALNVREAGIILESLAEGARLENYIISGNISRVEDRIRGNRFLISNNLE